MKPSTFTTVPPGGEAVSRGLITPTTTSDIKTYTIPVGASAFYISVGTTDATMTFDGSDPTGGTGVLYIAKGTTQLILLGGGTQIRAVSTASANAVISIFPVY